MKRRARLWQLVLPLLGLGCLASGVAEDLPDPTRPPRITVAPSSTGTVATPRQTRLEAVLHSEGRAVAIIDGKLLRVGDWLGDARIDAIGSDAVHLTREGRKLTLRLANKAMKVRRTTPTKDPQ